MSKRGGAFVSTPNREIAVNVSLGGFSNDLTRTGKIPTSKLLSLEVIANPDDDLAEVMKLQPGDELIKVERLRLANNIPLAIHTAWVNRSYCPRLLEYNLAQESLFSILRDVYHLKVKKRRRKFMLRYPIIMSNNYYRFPILQQSYMNSVSLTWNRARLLNTHVRLIVVISTT
jgi:DNA-binding GntR family transcriptional regulator